MHLLFFNFEQPILVNLINVNRKLGRFRTAEALLELCAIDLMLDNTVDCRSKLMLICHLMGVSMPIAADSNSNSIRNQVDTTPITPVVIKKGRRKGFNAKTINEIPVSVQQDATNRHLQLPFNHDGTSPSTKVREVVPKPMIFLFKICVYTIFIL